MHVGTDSVKFLYRFRPFNSKLCVNFYFDTRHGRLRSGLLQSTYPFRERQCQICITSNHRYSSYFFLGYRLSYAEHPNTTAAS